MPPGTPPITYGINPGAPMFAAAETTTTAPLASTQLASWNAPQAPCLWCKVGKPMIGLAVVGAGLAALVGWDIGRGAVRGAAIGALGGLVLR